MIIIQMNLEITSFLHSTFVLFVTMGLFRKERITFRKPFQNVIRTLSWFESLILPFVNAKLF